MLTAEEWSQYTIDLLDPQLTHGHMVPLFEAVYHGDPLFHGGRRSPEPYDFGRFWLFGNQNGWHGFEGHFLQVLQGNPAQQKWKPHAEYYVKLLQCHDPFARPCLAYGRMLRPPGPLPAECRPCPPRWGRGGREASNHREPDGSSGDQTPPGLLME